jgi:hypothetical protein
MNRSLVWNSDLNKWIVIGTGAKWDPSLSKDVWGFYFSTSDDLIHWSPRQLLMETEVFWGLDYFCGDPDPRDYPSLIDSNSPSPNFDVVDNNTYLYFTKFNYNGSCLQGPDRDLIRVPIQFSP